MPEKSPDKIPGISIFESSTVDKLVTVSHEWEDENGYSTYTEQITFDDIAKLLRLETCDGDDLTIDQQNTISKFIEYRIDKADNCGGSQLETAVEKYLYLELNANRARLEKIYGKLNWRDALEGLKGEILAALQELRRMYLVLDKK